MAQKLCLDCSKPLASRRKNVVRCRSCSHKGKTPKNFEHFKTFSNNRKGTTQSDEWKKKMSDHMKKIGNKPPDMTGIKCSDEKKTKIGRANFKGGKGEFEGYIRVNIGEDAKRKRIFEHRLVMEQKLGRKLTREEVVHHIDHDRKNNDPDNLMLMANAREHRLYHAQHDY